MKKKLVKTFESEKHMNVSIIITTYNSAELIEKTLDSIINQTYKNYEVVIVDDGSVDNTIAIIEGYILTRNLNNFKIISSMHIGRGKALNHAVQSSQFDWIAIVDSDDLWNRHKLNHQVTAIIKHKIYCLATKARLFTYDNDVDTNDVADSCKNTLRLIKYDSLLCRNPISHSSILIKKELLMYDETRASQFDYALWLNLASAGIKIYILEEILTYHRLHKNQSFESKNRFRYIVRSIKLQLRYCVRDRRAWPACIVSLKFIYYIFVNRHFIILFSRIFKHNYYASSVRHI